jgi:hypothetical protein
VPPTTRSRIAAGSSLDDCTCPDSHGNYFSDFRSNVLQPIVATINNTIASFRYQAFLAPLTLYALCGELLEIIDAHISPALFVSTSGRILYSSGAGQAGLDGPVSQTVAVEQLGHMRRFQGQSPLPRFRMNKYAIRNRRTVIIGILRSRPGTPPMGTFVFLACLTPTFM